MFSLRRFFLGVGISIGFSLLAFGASASPENPKSGVEYQVLEHPQPAEAGKKIEVTEFFLYSCPHCYAFDPALTEWVKKQGDKIAFKRVHVSFSESMAPQQRLYLTLEAMALPKAEAEELHKKIFNAIHAEHQPLIKEDAIVEFVVKNGVDKAKFLELYRSFSIQTKATRANQMQNSYKIDGVPTVAIDGRFLTSPALAGTSLPAKATEAARASAALQVMDVLLAKVGQERGLQAKSTGSDAASVASSSTTTKTKTKNKTKKNVSKEAQN